MSLVPSPAPSNRPFGRRSLLAAAGAAVAASVVRPAAPLWANLLADVAKPKAASPPEPLVKTLFDTLSEKQRKQICFDWDFRHPKRGLLRTRIENNWHITTQTIGSAFYTPDQQQLIRQIYEGMLNPEWVPKIDQQLKDDAGGYGKAQNIAIFGTPGTEKFELVMTGRHFTMRVDGNTQPHVAFGGPIFHGHAPSGLFEKKDHKNNIFWPQALAANRLYGTLDGKQQKLALVTDDMPDEDQIAFRGKTGEFQGVPVTELSADQKAELQKVLAMLLEPYRTSDQNEALACLKTQGGLDACHLAFYEEADLGRDKVWDNWRLEGPSFVWHFRGHPHVHIWINVADAEVPLNAFQDSIMTPEDVKK